MILTHTKATLTLFLRERLPSRTESSFLILDPATVADDNHWLATHFLACSATKDVFQLFLGVKDALIQSDEAVTASVGAKVDDEAIISVLELIVQFVSPLKKKGPQSLEAPFLSGTKSISVDDS